MYLNYDCLDCCPVVFLLCSSPSVPESKCLCFGLPRPWLPFSFWCNKVTWLSNTLALLHWLFHLCGVDFLWCSSWVRVLQRIPQSHSTKGPSLVKTTPDSAEPPSPDKTLLMAFWWGFPLQCCSKDVLPLVAGNYDSHSGITKWWSSNIIPPFR